MDFENFSEWASQISVDRILSGDLSAFVSLFYLIIAIAIYSILIWHFYRFIARRNCFQISMKKYPKVVGFLKYFFIFPFVAYLFFMGFSLLMLFLTRGYEIEAVLSTSFAIIVAIRITAYYSEDLSKDVAKMLPFALLGIFLVNPSYYRFDDIMDRVYSLPEFFTLAIQFILIIILVEWILRILLTIYYAIFPKKSKPSVEEH
ncbi:MAG: hypothetical protein JSW60_09480 [Thermoplasmatales archaeon]|nr:MAG: hypothetical protein JSW60_09480 [Thermoplasmatales archaeon]